MSYYLFLDDERIPANVTWTQIPQRAYKIVRSYTEFVERIQKDGVPLFVTFDHDLADAHYAAMLKEANSILFDERIAVDYGPEKTGFDCAKWLVEFCHNEDLKFPEYTVHSMNPIGRQRIMEYIANAYRVGHIK